MIEHVPGPRSRRQRQGWRRPLWFVMLCAAIGAVVVSAAIAYVSHRWFALVLLYPALLGISGGLFAWMVAEEVSPDLEGSAIAALSGGLLAAGMYVLHHYLLYRLAGDDGGWWNYLHATAEAGMIFSTRPGRMGIGLGMWSVWGLRVLECAVAATCGAKVARLARLPH